MQRKKLLRNLQRIAIQEFLITLRFSASFASRRFNAAASVRPGGRGSVQRVASIYQKQESLRLVALLRTRRLMVLDAAGAEGLGRGRGENMGQKKGRAEAPPFPKETCLFLFVNFFGYIF